MRIHLRLLKATLTHIHADLSRPHAFAHERLGFLTCGVATVSGTDLLLLGQQWHPVKDDDYLQADGVGACFGPRAFRNILQLTYREPLSVLHVHRHEHSGIPQFSSIDVRSMDEFVPGFLNARPNYPHGALVLSHDAAVGAIWLTQGAKPLSVDRLETVGVPWRGRIPT